MKETYLNTLVQILGKGVMTLVSLWTIRLLAAKLGLSDYGILTLLSTVYLVLDTLADFGTKTIGVREFAKEIDKQIWEGFVGLRVILTVGAFSIGMVFVMINPVIAPYRLEAGVALLMLGLTSMAGVLELFAQTSKQLWVKVVTDILFPCLFLGWLITQGTTSLLYVYIAYLVARIVSLVVGIVILKKYVTLPNISLPSNKTVIRVLKMSLPMGLYLLLFTSYDRLFDTWIINHYFGSREVAIYGMAYKVYTNLVLPAYFFMNTMYPLLASRSSKETEYLKKSQTSLLGLSGLMYAFAFLVAPILFGFFVNDPTSYGVVLLRVLGIALLFSYQNHLWGYYLVARGKQKQLLFLGIFSLLVNLILNLILIPLSGPISAAVVTVLTEAVMYFGLRIYSQSL